MVFWHENLQFSFQSDESKNNDYGPCYVIILKIEKNDSLCRSYY